MSTKFKAMTFKVGQDKQLSEKIQNILFDMGYEWSGTGVGYFDNACDCIITDTHGMMFDSSRHSGESINIDWMSTPKEETVELNGKKYLRSDLTNQVGKQVVSALEEALNHIKPMD